MKKAETGSRFPKSLVIPAAGLSIFTGVLFGRTPRNKAEITVQVYNLASVDRQTLATAEAQSTRIFREAGVTASWLNCPVTVAEARTNPMCIAPCPPNRFAVRIIPELPEDPHETSLGVALTEGGIYTTIYFPRVDAYADERIASRSEILGHAIAHELGHLLLGPVPHTRFGIMRAEWTGDDLRSMAQGDLLFGPEQAALIREAAKRRTLGVPHF